MYWCISYLFTYQYDPICMYINIQYYDIILGHIDIYWYIYNVASRGAANQNNPSRSGSEGQVQPAYYIILSRVQAFIKQSAAQTLGLH